MLGGNACAYDMRSACTAIDTKHRRLQKHRLHNMSGFMENLIASVFARGCLMWLYY